MAEDTSTALDKVVTAVSQRSGEAHAARAARSRPCGAAAPTAVPAASASGGTVNRPYQGSAGEHEAGETS
eukprot:1639432-Lingulodinium_polyedra.AAC.1